MKKHLGASEIRKYLIFSIYRPARYFKRREGEGSVVSCGGRKFREKGDKVKVSLRYRGREMSHMSQTRHVLDDFAEKLADIAVIDKPAKMEGRSLVMFLRTKS